MTQGPSPGRILVVDDEAPILRVIERILTPRHRVTLATTPERAIRIADEDSYDVALVDVRMPGMDGFDLMKELRRRHPALDVILMTGSTDESDDKLIRALHSEAYFFLLKPFEKGILEALLDRCLSARRTREKNKAYVDALERELVHARDLQRSLLPPPLPARSPFRASASFRPCLAVGGDHYDWKSFGSSRLMVLLADVSGHGVSAAMITAMLKASFDRILEPIPPSEALKAIGSGLVNLESDRFVTAVIASFDSERDSLVYASAGHGPTLLARREDAIELPRTGPMLSTAVPARASDSPELSFSPGDRLVLFTDGVAETRSPSGELFGIERVRSAVNDASGGDLAPILERVDRFRDRRPATDDETLVIVSRAD